VVFRAYKKVSKKGDFDMSRIKLAALGLLLITFYACNSRNEETANQQPPAVAQPPQPEVQQPVPEPVAPAPAVKKEVQAPRKANRQTNTELKTPVQSSVPQNSPVAPANAPQAQPEHHAAVPAAPPKPPEPKFATVPSGTEIAVRLQDALDSGVNQTGESFRAILDKDIKVDGVVVAPRGSVLEGKLSHVERSGRVQGRATMSMQLTNLVIGNEPYALQTQVITTEAESTKTKDATKVGLGAGLGAAIGAIAGGGKGAAIGAAVGAGAGGATVVATRGKEVHFDSESKVTFVLSREISVKLR
jgi:hypothetical protein